MDLRTVHFIMTLVYRYEEIAQLAKKISRFSYTLIRKLMQFKPLKLHITEYCCTLLAEGFFCLLSSSIAYTIHNEFHYIIFMYVYNTF